VDAENSFHPGLHFFANGCQLNLDNMHSHWMSSCAFWIYNNYLI